MRSRKPSRRSGARAPAFRREILLPGGRRIGPGHPCLIVAEISGNHLGSLVRAKALVRAAAKAGADAVKLQTYTADTLTIDCDRPAFRIRGRNAWSGRRLHDLYEEAHTPWAWHAELFSLARRLGLLAFSTPFDATAVAFLERLRPPLHKIASFEIVDLDLVRTVARTGRPAILSTGMASEREIADALAAFAGTGNRSLVLLKCTSAYPAPLSEMNVRGMQRLAERFGAPVGLSDHCLNPVPALTAVARGACVLEKHLTLRRADGGPDAGFSLEPGEFAALVRSVREVEASLGAGELGPGVAEAGNVQFRRSIFAVADIAPGERLTRASVRVIRPGQGLAPRHLGRVLRMRAAKRIARGTPLAWKLLRG